MDFDCKCMRILGTAAISIVGYQLVTKFLPWLYINIIGPKLFGPKINVSKLGKWAGRCFIVEFIKEMCDR